MENDEENAIVQKLLTTNFNKNDTSPEKMPNFLGYSSDKMSIIGTDSDIYSPYAVFNRTGQSCFVEVMYNGQEQNPLQPKIYHCQNGRVCGIFRENNEDIYKSDYATGKEFRRPSQKIKVEIPLRLSYSFIISNIELSQISQKRYKLIYQNPLTNKEENYELLSHVELAGTKKILTLSSVNKLVNATNHKLFFRILHEKKRFEEFLDKEAEYHVPLAYAHFELAFQIDRSKEWSTTLISNELLNKAEEVIEFTLSNQHFIIRKDTSIKNMNVYVIEPPFIIKNFLPLPLSLNLHASSHLMV